jgi:hypothetical protein
VRDLFFISDLSRGINIAKFAYENSSIFEIYVSVLLRIYVYNNHTYR